MIGDRRIVFAQPLQRSNLCASHRLRRWLTYLSYHTLQAYLAYGKGMSVGRGKPDQDTKDHHRDPRGELAEKPSAIRQERGGR